eukprot:TRINITY_DN11324_c0_g1_i1.p2 TRINITY_DN11324_c0_g1~~TRINITY_DN11324_c0_g1_i1.p2  ORF type:complete len:137 (+),score=64.02 TRINITY_DN11324_c0_g1_i1:63-413(+)
MAPLLLFALLCLAGGAGARVAFVNNEAAEAHVPADPSLEAAYHMAAEFDARVEKQMEDHYEGQKRQQQLHAEQARGVWGQLEAEVLMVWVVAGIPALIAVLHMMRQRPAQPQPRRR